MTARFANRLLTDARFAVAVTHLAVAAAFAIGLGLAALLDALF